MTVAELIRELQRMDPNARVLVSGYEGGLTDLVRCPEAARVALDVNSDGWSGPHEYEWEDDLMYPEAAHETAVILPR